MWPALISLSLLSPFPNPDAGALRSPIQSGAVTGSAPLAQRPERLTESPYSFRETVDRLKAAVPANKMSIVFEIDLQQRLSEKQLSVEPTIILGLCSAGHAYKALADDIRITSMLPCRIAVTERTDGTGKKSVIVHSMNASLLGAMFEGENIKTVAEEVDAAMKKIVEQTVTKK